jgi:uncharacterized membrane protein YeaQ/YmgE (transglycosylase-associated protein family)
LKAISNKNEVRKEVKTMNILLWIVLGLLAGWFASIVMRTDAYQGTLTDIVLGVVGAVVGGILMNLLGQPGVTGFNFYSILVATLGAVVLIWFGRILNTPRENIV